MRTNPDIWLHNRLTYGKHGVPVMLAATTALPLALAIFGSRAEWLIGVVLTCSMLHLLTATLPAADRIVSWERDGHLDHHRLAGRSAPRILFTAVASSAWPALLFAIVGLGCALYAAPPEAKGSLWSTGVAVFLVSSAGSLGAVALAGRVASPIVPFLGAWVAFFLLLLPSELLEIPWIAVTLAVFVPSTVAAFVAACRVIESAGSGGGPRVDPSLGRPPRWALRASLPAETGRALAFALGSRPVALGLGVLPLVTALVAVLPLDASIRMDALRWLPFVPLVGCVYQLASFARREATTGAGDLVRLTGQASAHVVVGWALGIALPFWLCSLACALPLAATGSLPEGDAARLLVTALVAPCVGACAGLWQSRGNSIYAAFVGCVAQVVALLWMVPRLHDGTIARVADFSLPGDPAGVPVLLAAVAMTIAIGRFAEPAGAPLGSLATLVVTGAAVASIAPLPPAIHLRALPAALLLASPLLADGSGARSGRFRRLAVALLAGSATAALGGLGGAGVPELVRSGASASVVMLAALSLHEHLARFPATSLAARLVLAAALVASPELWGAAGIGLGRISGIVSGPDGPVAGALVALVPGGADLSSGDPLPRPAAVVRTNTSGAFQLEGLTEGSYAVTATSPGLQAGYRGELSLGMGGSISGLALRLRNGGLSYTGTVRGADGRPIAGAQVHAARMSMVQGDLFVTESDDAGRYRIDLPSAMYLISPSAPGFEMPHPRGTEDDGAGAAAHAGIDFVMEPSWSGAPPRELRPWLRERAIPLASAAPGSGLADMEPILDVVGDARIVSLGEATHGTAEFFQLKHRMLELLVERKGFTVFAIEANMADAVAVNRYVLEGEGDPALALKGLGFWTWDTQEVLALVTWMRRYNEEPSHTRKLSFHGFDMQDPLSTVDRYLRYLAPIDPVRARRLEEDLSPLLARNLLERQAMNRELKSSILATLVAEARWLDAQREILVGESGEAAWRLATRLVAVARQGVLLSKGPSLLRDLQMADNVTRILEDEPPGTKIVLWAHDMHVAGAGGSMGSHLRERFGEEMVVVGFAFREGSFRAVEVPGRSFLREFTIGPPAMDSVDDVLDAVGLPLFAVDLRGAAGDAARWLSTRHPKREIGAIFSERTAERYVISLAPATAFDALLFVRSTTAAVGNPKLVRLGAEAPGVRAVRIPAPENGGFELGPPGALPDGWSLAARSAFQGFRAAASADRPREGSRCLEIEGAGGKRARGIVLQKVDATPFRGRQLLFQAWVRSELTGDDAYARIWVRVDRPHGAVGHYDDLGARAIKQSADWQRMQVVGNVADDAESIVYGAVVSGAGRAWVDDASLELRPLAR